jgi:hypothetical protein
VKLLILLSIFSRLHEQRILILASHQQSTVSFQQSSTGDRQSPPPAASPWRLSALRNFTPTIPSSQ